MYPELAIFLRLIGMEVFMKIYIYLILFYYRLSLLMNWRVGLLLCQELRSKAYNNEG